MAFAVPIATNASMTYQIHAHQPVPAHQHASSHAYSGRLGTPGALRDAPDAHGGLCSCQIHERAVISPGQQRATRAASRSPEPSHTGQHTPLAQRTSLPIPIPARATDSGSEVAIRLLPACCDIALSTRR